MLLPVVCWLLLQLSGYVHASVFFPDVNLTDAELVWRNGMPPIIDEPEKCRNRPPFYLPASNGTIFYVMSYLRDGNCRYAIVDNEQSGVYEVDVDPGQTDYNPNNCTPAPGHFLNDQICLMNAVNIEHILIFCPGDHSNVTGYLINLRKASAGLVMTALDSRTWDKWDSVSPKHFLALVRYPIGGDIVLVGNNPSWLIHVKLGAQPKIAGWIGGNASDNSTEYLKYYQKKLKATPPDFSNCTYTAEDENYCTYRAEGKTPILNTVVGAFNQFQCLRVRRGTVHYEASAVNASLFNPYEPYGFIIESVYEDIEQIRDTLCFYTPIYALNNLLAIWTGDSTYMCKYGVNVEKVPTRIDSLNDDALCQTAILPNETMGKFRIVGMEPTNYPKRGHYDLPQIAIYNGVDTDPEYLGDPMHLLQKNCYVEENRMSTALAHFYIAPIDFDHFLVICNRRYGSKMNEQLDRGSTAIYYEYNGTIGLLQPLAFTSFESWGFADTRGIIMMPTKDRQRFHFLQIQPCIYVVLDVGGQEPSLTATVGPDECTQEDVQPATSEVGIPFREFKKCNFKTCSKVEGKAEITIGKAYRPDNYITDDILSDLKTFLIGQNGCLESNFQEVIVDNEIRRVYNFKPQKGNGRQLCFAPFSLSAGFQILSEDNSKSFCKNPFKYAGTVERMPTTTVGPIAEVDYPELPDGGDVDDVKAKKCPSYNSRLKAVAIATCIMCASLCVLVLVVAGVHHGKRNYPIPTMAGYTEQSAMGEESKRIAPAVGLSSEPVSALTFPPTMADTKTASAYGYVYPAGIDPNAKRTPNDVTHYANDLPSSLMGSSEIAKPPKPVEPSSTIEDILQVHPASAPTAQRRAR